MRLGTRTRYGVRALLELALNHGNGVLSTREIATRQQVSLKYLENLLAALRSTDLVRSVRGAQGGHMLARNPAQINLRDVYEALEGTDGFVLCTTCPDVCDRTEICVTREIWDELYVTFVETLASITLEDLTRRDRSKKSAQAAMYHI
jgi:Rrf2 family protein